MEMKGKRVTVIGLARSGVGAANLLARLGSIVTVTDRKRPEELQEYREKLDPAITLALGGHPPELFQEADLVVVSPGVPLNIPPLKMAFERGIKVIGELELAYQVISKEPGARSRESEFLAVTGTNGKSTTTLLLYEMLKDQGFPVLLGGNIGTALTEELIKSGVGSRESTSGGSPKEEERIDYLVAEVSSFQLESIDEFRPKGATILNITPDHLDRYSSMEEYIDAKCRVFVNQGPEDYLVLNADDPATGEVARRIGRLMADRGDGPEVLYFSRKHQVRGAYYRDGLIHFNAPDVAASFILNPESFKIKGVHNIENAMAAALMALLSGCTGDSLRGTLGTFPGLEHRLEFVRELEGITFINDSKGTNVGAVIKSVESFDEPIVLIAGGRDKHGDFSVLRPLVEEKVKALILIGEAKETIREALGDLTMPVFMEDDFRAAIVKARGLAAAGDVVLLSPACASFDMFRDFEDRGRQFKEAVMEL